MPEAVESIFDSNPARPLQRQENALPEVLQRLNAAVAVWKYEIQISAGADQPPLAESVHCQWHERDVPTASFRLRRSEASPRVGTLPNVDQPRLEVDVAPRQ